MQAQCLSRFLESRQEERLRWFRFASSGTERSTSFTRAAPEIPIEELVKYCGENKRLCLASNVSAVDALRKEWTRVTRQPEGTAGSDH